MIIIADKLCAAGETIGDRVNAKKKAMRMAKVKEARKESEKTISSAIRFAERKAIKNGQKIVIRLAEIRKGKKAQPGGKRSGWKLKKIVGRNAVKSA